MVLGQCQAFRAVTALTHSRVLQLKSCCCLECLPRQLADALSSVQSIAKMLGDQRATTVALLNDTKAMDTIHGAGSPLKLGMLLALDTQLASLEAYSPVVQDLT